MMYKNTATIFPKVKAILIDATNKTVTEIMVDNSYTSENGMYKAIKCQTIEHYPWRSKDCLLVDEEGTFHADDRRFLFNRTVVVGNALVVGSEGENYADCKSTLEEIKALVVFPVPDKVDNNELDAYGEWDKPRELY